MNKKTVRLFKKRFRRKVIKNIIKKDVYYDISSNCLFRGIKVNPINIKRAASMNYHKYCKSYEGVILHLDRATHFAGIENLDKYYNHQNFAEEQYRLECIKEDLK